MVAGAGPVKPRKGGSAKSRAPIRSGGFDVERFIIEDVLGVRTPKPGQPQINEAGIGSGLAKIAVAALKGAGGGRVLQSPGAQFVKSQVASGTPANRVLLGMARESARGTGKTVRAAGSTVSAGVRSAPKSVRYGVGAGAAGTALYYTGRATSGDKKSGYVPMTSRTKKMQGYVPMTVPSSAVAVVKSRSTAGYVPNVPSSPRKKLTPSTPTVEKPKTTKKPGGGTKTTIGGGQVPGRRPGTSVRTAAVQKRLSLAAEEAAKGNSAAAAAYANAALNIQKKGKGSAASMKKVQKAAAAYAKAAKK